MYGADEGTRTPDLLITNRLLYQLSHIGKTEVVRFIPSLTRMNYTRIGLICQAFSEIFFKEFFAGGELDKYAALMGCSVYGYCAEVEVHSIIIMKEYGYRPEG